MIKKLLIVATLGLLLTACGDEGVSTSGAYSPINIIEAGDDVSTPIQASPSGTAQTSCPVDTPVIDDCSVDSAAECTCKLP